MYCRNHSSSIKMPRADANARERRRYGRRPVLDRFRTEDPAIQAHRIEQHFLKLFLQLAAEPASNRNPETHLGATLDGRGSKSENACFRITFDLPWRNRIFRLTGMAIASSTTRWSRNGARH